MITFFNRKELLVTFSMERQAAVRDVLAVNGIEYTVKVVNRKSASAMGGGSRGRMGTFGEDLNLAYEYVIYVKRSDFEQASYFVR